MKEGNAGYCQCPQLASSISEKSASVVSAGAPLCCLSNVSMESGLPVDVLCDRRCPLSKSRAWLLHYPCVEPGHRAAGLVLACTLCPGLQEDLWLFTLG